MRKGAGHAFLLSGPDISFLTQNHLVAVCSL